MCAVPMLSKGFIAATIRKLDSASILPTLGMVISRSAIAVSRVLSVSSGTRLNSSM